MDQPYIEENDVIARYLADQLSDHEREAFELICRTNRSVLHEVEATAQYKAGLMAWHATSVPAKSRGHWALAASLFAVFIVGLLGALNPLSKQPIMSSTLSELSGRLDRELPIGGSYTIRRTRSNSYDASIGIQQDTVAIVLRIRPGFGTTTGVYRATLFQAGNRSAPALASVDNLRLNAEGFVVVYFNSDAIASGAYEISITDQNAHASLSTNEAIFSIEVTRS